MANLTAGPDAPLIAHVAANAILFLHIAGGSVGMVSGIVALFAPKGGRVHRVCGNVFFVSMCITYLIGAGVAPFLDTGQRPNFIAGVFAFYLVVTSWVTIRRKDRCVGWVEVAGFAVALSTAVAGAVFIRMAASDPTGTIDGSPPQAFYVFLVFGIVASIDDFIVLVRRGTSGVGRIARHLWRMCAALFFATGSFFLGQPQVFPEYLRGSALLYVPVLLPLLMMLFWVPRVFLTKWYARRNRDALHSEQSAGSPALLTTPAKSPPA